VGKKESVMWAQRFIVGNLHCGDCLTGLKLPHNLVVMHIEKNVCENILCTLLNVSGKTKDTHDTRLDLYDMGIRHHLHLREKGNNLVSAPPAPYVLEKDQKVQFCKFLKGIKFPDGYAANLAIRISEDGSRVVGKLKDTFLPHTTSKNHTCWT
jgi:hypothetical protein